MNYPISKKLIDRNKQREKINSILSESKEKGSFVSLEFYGIGGLGKSRILEIAKEECRKRNLPFATIDFLVTDRQNTQHPDLDILLRICDNLDIFTDFTKGRLFSASLIRNGKNLKTKSDNIITNQEVLTGFHNYLVEALDGRPLIMMLDSIEHCPDDLFNWLGKEFLAPLSMTAPVILFLAGRGPRVRESRWPILLKHTTESLRLDPLAFEHSREQIQAIQNETEYHTEAKKIYALSNGHTYSTEAIVYWLHNLGVEVQDVETHREELARRLRMEVIQKYILSDADEWVLPFLEIVSYFRWFSSSLISEFIQKYRPELGKDQPIQWYTARLVDLQKRPLHYIYLDKDHYLLEQTLQKLLHIVNVILDPREAEKIHKEAVDYLELDLQNIRSTGKGLSTGNNTASIIVEILFHETQKTLIQGEELYIGEKMIQILQDYFDPKDSRDLEILSFLKNSLEQDAELSELLTTNTILNLVNEIDSFLTPSPTPDEPFQLSHLIIEHNPPTEYRVSWYLANRQVIPTEFIVSVQDFDITEWSSDTLETGKTAFTAYLPERTQNFIKTKKDWAIQLTTNRPEIPWELLYDDDKFLCLSRPIGRRPEMINESKDTPDKIDDIFRALVVGNPTEDLPCAEEEVKEIAKELEAKKFQVDLLLGKDATAKQFAKKIRNEKYDLIHFAGHAYFEPNAPRMSGLLFAETPMPAEEFGRHLKQSRSLVFLSACAAGMVKTTQSNAGMIGEFIDGIATSILLTGAIGCVAPMWTIHDGAAKDFSIEFYKHLLSGVSTGESLRQARIKLYNENNDTWKPWVLYGDPTANPFIQLKGKIKKQLGRDK